MPTTVAPLELLARGAIALKGRIPWGSNVVFLAEVTTGAATTLAVYKPGRGERPLWDFPPNLFRREVAAWELSEALGWGLVPPTVEREGPHGPGSLQLFIQADFEQHYFSLRERPAHHRRLKQLCLFDLVANNADRKGGHCLLGDDGVIYAIDNALCFHAEPKLRTVIWDFGGQRIPRALLDDLERLCTAPLPAGLTALLAPAERDALRARAQAVVARGRFPATAAGRPYPWPLV